MSKKLKGIGGKILVSGAWHDEVAVKRVAGNVRAGRKARTAIALTERELELVHGRPRKRGRSPTTPAKPRTPTTPITRSTPTIPTTTPSTHTTRSTPTIPTKAPKPSTAATRASTRARNVRRLVKDWTHDGYINVAHARDPSFPRKGTENIGRGMRIDAALARFMREMAPRAPSIPTGVSRPKYLYRGMCGEFARRLVSGEYAVTLPSYIATSRSGQVAIGFAGDGSNGAGCIIARIEVSDVPRGTPWMWFSYRGAGQKGKRNVAPTTKGTELEVLLPPGTLRARRAIRERYYHMKPRFRDGRFVRESVMIPIVDVEYTPDIRATAITSNKPIVRRLGPPRLNSNTAPRPVPSYEQTWRLFENMRVTPRKKASRTVIRRVRRGPRR